MDKIEENKTPVWFQSTIHHLSLSLQQLTYELQLHCIALKTLRRAESITEYLTFYKDIPSDLKAEHTCLFHDYVNRSVDQEIPWFSKVMIQETYRIVEKFFQMAVATSLLHIAQTKHVLKDDPLFKDLTFDREYIENRQVNQALMKAAERVGQKLKYKQHKGLERFEVWISIFPWFSRGNSKLFGAKRGIHVSHLVDELMYFRNCIEHNNGLVDRKVRKECSWLSLEIGSPLPVSLTLADRFIGAAYILALDIDCRVTQFTYGESAEIPDELFELHMIDHN